MPATPPPGPQPGTREPEPRSPGRGPSAPAPSRAASPGPAPSGPAPSGPAPSEALPSGPAAAGPAPSGPAPSALRLSPEEVRSDLSTRQARLKWVIVVDEALPAGRQVNAAACTAAAVGAAVPGLLGRGGDDASGGHHPGLPWAGCSVLAAGARVLRELRARAAEAGDELLITDMPGHAQTARVYDAYLEALAGTKAEDLDYLAVGLVGPRKRIDKLVGGLPLLR